MHKIEKKKQQYLQSINQFCFTSTVAPLNIRLLGAHQPLSAGRRYDLLCQSAGSRPPAVITWFRDGERLDRTTETVCHLNMIDRNFDICAMGFFFLCCFAYLGSHSGIYLNSFYTRSADVK